MKKLLSFLCILTMAFTLAACGSRGGLGNDSGAKPPTSQPGRSQEPGQQENSGQPSEENNEKLAPDANIGEGLAINYSGGASMPSDVSAWLEANEIK